MAAKVKTITKAIGSEFGAYVAKDIYQLELMVHVKLVLKLGGVYSPHGRGK